MKKLFILLGLILIMACITSCGVDTRVKAKFIDEGGCTAIVIVPGEFASFYNYGDTVWVHLPDYRVSNIAVKPKKIYSNNLPYTRAVIE